MYLTAFTERCFRFDHLNILSVQQLPHGFYAGHCLASSSVAPDSVTSPTVGYNVRSSNVFMPVMAPLILVMTTML